MDRDLPRISKRIVVIGGFRQRPHELTGLERLWLELQELYGFSAHVTFHPWNENWGKFVDFVLATGPLRRSLLDVRIVSYSYGTGWGALQLARRLDLHGVNVTCLASCDGVFRPRWLKTRALWSWILPEPRIVVPPNVRRVDYVTQLRSEPNGHRIVASSPTTVVKHHGIVADADHLTIDESEEFRALAIGACA